MALTTASFASGIKGIVAFAMLAGGWQVLYRDPSQGAECYLRVSRLMIEETGLQEDAEGGEIMECAG